MLQQIWTHCFSVVTYYVVSYYRFFITDPDAAIAEAGFWQNFSCHICHRKMNSSDTQLKLHKNSRSPFLTSPLGENFVPRGEVVSQGGILSMGVKLSPGGEILCLPLHTPGGEQRGEHYP
jgi:hypothetical protein